MIPVKGQHGGLLIAFNGGKSWRLQLLKTKYDQILTNLFVTMQEAGVPKSLLARRERNDTVYSLTYRQDHMKYLAEEHSTINDYRTYGGAF